MSKEIKMSDKFGSVPNFSIEEFISDDSALAIPNVHMLYDAIDHAINNHDTLTEQVKQLREALVDSQRLINSIGIIHFNNGYSDNEKHKLVKITFDFHGDDIFLTNKKLLEATK